MPGKSANPVPKPSHTWQTPQNTEWNSRIQERRVLRERFMPSTDLALVGGFQTAAGWGVTGLFGCCTTLSLYSLFAGPDNSALIPSLIFAAFTIGGGILLKKGSKNRRLVRHFRQICTLIGTKEYISTKELCDSMHCEQSAITSEVLGMDGAKNYAKENQMTETWDASLGQNVATVETSDARYTIWMEDEQSMEEKLKVIQSADLAGVAARIRVRRRLESDFRIY